jgi:hypothetical protein
MTLQLRVVESKFSAHAPKSNRLRIATTQRRGAGHGQQRISVAGDQEIDRLTQFGNRRL